MTLAKTTHLPIMLAGRAPDATSSNELTEAELTQKILNNEFRIRARWAEKQSTTTEKNAVFLARMIKQEGIAQIYLNTHFWRIPTIQVVF